MTTKKGIDSKLQSILEVIYKKNTQESWDAVMCVAGDEGTGKSNFDEWLIHYWYLLKNGRVTEDEVKHMCMDRNEWLSDFSDCEKYDATNYDESDLYSRKSMDSFNVKVNQTYQIVRADGLFSILTLPSLWDLDSFFRNRRLRYFVHVYARGKYAFWSKSRLRQMVQMNARFPVKNYYVVKPTHRGWFSTYDGPFSEAYKRKKELHTKKARRELLEGSDKQKRDFSLDKRNDLIKSMLKRGLNCKDVERITGLSYRQLMTIKKGFKGDV